jgi:exosortase
MQPTSRRLQHAAFLTWCLFCAALFRAPLRQLLALSLNDSRYSHLLLIPFLSAALIFWRRRTIFRASASQPALGVPLAILTAACGPLLAPRLLAASADYGLTLAALAVLFACGSGFLLCYGMPALRSARFPLLMLLLMAPVPPPAMARLITLLQTGSSEVTYALFRLIGMPIFRDGTRFELTGVNIEIAGECSSIHSGWALFIMALLVGHVVLRSFPAKAALCLLTLPIAVFTNGIRIVTICYLATHVDMRILDSDLHRRGGILFSLISLAILLLAVYALRKLEVGQASSPVNSSILSESRP